MKPITTEYLVMACILGMFIRDMVIEFKPKKQHKVKIESIKVGKEK
jgi:hypothetical protein